MLTLLALVSAFAVVYGVSARRARPGTPWAVLWGGTGLWLALAWAILRKAIYG